MLEVVISRGLISFCVKLPFTSLKFTKVWAKKPVYYVETPPFALAPALPYMVILRYFYRRFMGYDFLREIYRKS